jgi:hypothetical protein
MIPGQQVAKRGNFNKKKNGGSGKTMKRKRSQSNGSQNGGGMNYEQLLKHRENRTA